MHVEVISQDFDKDFVHYKQQLQHNDNKEEAKINLGPQGVALQSRTNGDIKLLKQHYMTPNEVGLSGSSNIHQLMKSKNTVHHEYSLTSNSVDRGNNNILNGFNLLEATGMGLPDEGRFAALVERGFTEVVDEDVSFFTSLEYLDVSENNLLLESFQSLSSLVELKIACNNIFNISQLYGFDMLQRLDLSYNKLTVMSISCLGALPNLNELDLCGNDLKGLPIDMFRFKSLEKILLEHNKLDDDQVFIILSAIPRVRTISLAYNFLSHIPQACCNDDNFKVLETLDLSFNYIGTEPAMAPLLNLNNLSTFIIYGNPVCGPTGEDALQVYISDFVEESINIRSSRNKKLINIISELPRARGKLKKGQSLGRQATYRDFNIVQIDVKKEPKSNREWRTDGNKSLFSEAVNIARKNKLTNVVDGATFLTSIGNYEPENEVDTTAMIAEIVMGRVAKDLNIGQINRDDLFTLSSMANVNTITFNDDYRNTQYDNNEYTDKVPDTLFRNEMAVGDRNIGINPVPTHTAIRALKNAINYPLTNYDEVPGKGFLPPKGYVQQTAASVNRQLPYNRDLKSILEEDNRRYSLEHLQDAKSNEQRGIPEPLQARKTRDIDRDLTLEKIEQVLDNLNDKVDTFSKKKTSNSSSSSGKKMNDSIKTMKDFARPGTEGLSRLLDMVNDIVADLDS